jgi:hypothetical protein
VLLVVKQEHEKVERTGVKKEIKRQLMIANFSIGGSPSAAFPVGPNPIPAGSSDGNAMIFFYDEAAAPKPRADAGEKQPDHPASSLRVVTTTNLLGPAPMTPIGRGPRSYIFAVEPNEALPFEGKLPKYYPTLVLYFDENTKKDIKHDTTLKIYRFTDNAWKPINDMYQQEFGKRYLVAAQLNQKTAPGLFSASPSPEYYRLFLI